MVCSVLIEIIIIVNLFYERFLKDLTTQLDVTFVYMLVTSLLLEQSWGQDGPQPPPRGPQDRFCMDFGAILAPILAPKID